VVGTPARREVVRWICNRGLTERQALTVIGMSASSFRYLLAPDRRADRRQTIVVLAHRHRRYGAGMMYLQVRQQGLRVNHKRIERLYAEAQLQVWRRTRKKMSVGDRQPRMKSGPWISLLTAVRKAGPSHG